MWVKLRITQTLFVLHNPRYAGAYVFGRTRTHKTLQGSHLERLPEEQWHTLLQDAHARYISWKDYQENQRRLQENAYALGSERRKSPPREGPALLQGLVICGICGERMKVVYHVRSGLRLPDYLCDGRTVNDPQPVCQWISGTDVDSAVSEVLVGIMTPVAIEVTLAVQQELQARLDEVDRLRKQQVERARYEAELAQRRYMRVDPLCNVRKNVAQNVAGPWNHACGRVVRHIKFSLRLVGLVLVPWRFDHVRRTFHVVQSRRPLFQRCLARRAGTAGSGALRRAREHPEWSDPTTSTGSHRLPATATACFHYC